MPKAACSKQTGNRHQHDPSNSNTMRRSSLGSTSWQRCGWQQGLPGHHFPDQAPDGADTPRSIYHDYRGTCTRQNTRSGSVDSMTVCSTNFKNYNIEEHAEKVQPCSSPESQVTNSLKTRDGKCQKKTRRAGLFGQNRIFALSLAHLGEEAPQYIPSKPHAERSERIECDSPPDKSSPPVITESTCGQQEEVGPTAVKADNISKSRCASTEGKMGSGPKLASKKEGKNKSVPNQKASRERKVSEGATNTTTDLQKEAPLETAAVVETHTPESLTDTQGSHFLYSTPYYHRGLTNIKPTQNLANKRDLPNETSNKFILSPTKESHLNTRQPDDKAQAPPETSQQTPKSQVTSSEYTVLRSSGNDPVVSTQSARGVKPRATVPFSAPRSNTIRRMSPRNKRVMTCHNRLQEFEITCENWDPDDDVEVKSAQRCPEEVLSGDGNPKENNTRTAVFLEDKQGEAFRKTDLLSSPHVVCESPVYEDEGSVRGSTQLPRQEHPSVSPPSPCRAASEPVVSETLSCDDQCPAKRHPKVSPELGALAKNWEKSSRAQLKVCQTPVHSQGRSVKDLAPSETVTPKSAPSLSEEFPAPKPGKHCTVPCLQERSGSENSLAVGSVLTFIGMPEESTAALSTPKVCSSQTEHASKSPSVIRNRETWPTHHSNSLQRIPGQLGNAAKPHPVRAVNKDTRKRTENAPHIFDVARQPSVTGDQTTKSTIPDSEKSTSTSKLSSDKVKVSVQNPRIPHDKPGRNEVQKAPMNTSPFEISTRQVVAFGDEAKAGPHLNDNGESVRSNPVQVPCHENWNEVAEDGTSYFFKLEVGEQMSDKSCNSFNPRWHIVRKGSDVISLDAERRRETDNESSVSSLLEPLDKVDAALSLECEVKPIDRPRQPDSSRREVGKEHLVTDVILDDDEEPVIDDVRSFEAGPPHNKETHTGSAFNHIGTKIRRSRSTSSEPSELKSFEYEVRREIMDKVSAFQSFGADFGSLLLDKSLAASDFTDWMSTAYLEQALIATGSVDSVSSFSNNSYTSSTEKLNKECDDSISCRDESVRLGDEGPRLTPSHRPHSQNIQVAASLQLPQGLPPQHTTDNREYNAELYQDTFASGSLGVGATCSSQLDELWDSDLGMDERWGIRRDVRHGPHEMVDSLPCTTNIGKETQTRTSLMGDPRSRYALGDREAHLGFSSLPVGSRWPRRHRTPAEEPGPPFHSFPARSFNPGQTQREFGMGTPYLPPWSDQSDGAGDAGQSAGRHVAVSPNVAVSPPSIPLPLLLSLQSPPPPPSTYHPPPPLLSPEGRPRSVKYDTSPRCTLVYEESPGDHRAEHRDAQGQNFPPVFVGHPQNTLPAGPNKGPPVRSVVYRPDAAWLPSQGIPHEQSAFWGPHKQPFCWDDQNQGTPEPTSASSMGSLGNFPRQETMLSKSHNYHHQPSEGHQTIYSSRGNRICQTAEYNAGQNNQKGSPQLMSRQVQNPKDPGKTLPKQLDTRRFQRKTSGRQVITDTKSSKSPGLKFIAVSYLDEGGSDSSAPSPGEASDPSEQDTGNRVVEEESMVCAPAEAAPSSISTEAHGAVDPRPDVPVHRPSEESAIDITVLSRAVGTGHVGDSRKFISRNELSRVDPGFETRGSPSPRGSGPPEDAGPEESKDQGERCTQRKTEQQESLTPSSQDERVIECYTIHPTENWSPDLPSDTPVGEAQATDTSDTRHTYWKDTQEVTPKAVRYVVPSRRRLSSEMAMIAETSQMAPCPVTSECDSDEHITNQIHLKGRSVDNDNPRTVLPLKKACDGQNVHVSDLENSELQNKLPRISNRPHHILWDSEAELQVTVMPNTSSLSTSAEDVPETWEERDEDSTDMEVAAANHLVKGFSEDVDLPISDSDSEPELHTMVRKTTEICKSLLVTSDVTVKNLRTPEGTLPIASTVVSAAGKNDKKIPIDWFSEKPDYERTVMEYSSKMPAFDSWTSIITPPSAAQSSPGGMRTPGPSPGLCCGSIGNLNQSLTPTSDHETTSPRFRPWRKKTRWSVGSKDEELVTLSEPVWQTAYKRRYENLTVPFIDTHCHLDFLFKRSGFKGTFIKYRKVNENTFPLNYGGCVAVFCDPRTFNRAGGLWSDLLMEETVWGAIGCHPKCASQYDLQAEESLKVMIKHRKVVALGEIGLDYSGTFYQHRDVQISVFRRQIKIALDVNLPLVIHCRDAEDDCIQVLEEMVPRNHKIHRHCFTGSWAQAEVWLRKFTNSFIGLTPLVTYRGGRSVGPREVASNMPLDRLLLETDAPYFVPQRVPRDEMIWSHPGMAITVADEVAQLAGHSLPDVLQACRENTHTMYGI